MEYSGHVPSMCWIRDSSGPPARQARSTAWRHDLISMESPGQSWTAFSPASRFRNSVVLGSMVQRSEVFPIPWGPKMTPFTRCGWANLSSAVMILKAMTSP